MCIVSPNRGNIGAGNFGFDPRGRWTGAGHGRFGADRRNGNLNRRWPKKRRAPEGARQSTESQGVRDRLSRVYYEVATVRPTWTATIASFVPETSSPKIVYCTPAIV